MFEKQEFRSLCIERENVHPEAYWEYHRIWKLLLDIILKDKRSFHEFIEYMKTEMTESEYSTLSEISDEIAYEYPSFAFIDAYKMLAEKYPEETKKYYIAGFIKDAEASVRCSMNEGRTMY